MSATTAISRTSHLHRTIRRLSLLQYRSFFTSPSSPVPNLPHSASFLSPRHFPPTQSQEFRSFGLLDNYRRAFSTSPPSASVIGGDGTPTASEMKISPSAGGGGNSQGSQQSDDAGGGNSQGSQQSGNAGKSVRGSPVSWISFLLLLVTGAGLTYYYDQEKKRHIEEISNVSNKVREGPSVGQAAIGGPFKLVNHEGKNVTEKDFLGKWTVMYFGFTHCPDICPDELVKLAAAVDKIKEKAGIEIVPVFISVDPERDNVEQVSEYVKEFHPKLIGLTGDPEEIRKVARSYRVYYMKTNEEGDDYLVDHSIVMYLMSPQMEFVKFYGKNNDIDGLTNGIIKEVKQYKK